MGMQGSWVLFTNLFSPGVYKNGLRRQGWNGGGDMSLNSYPYITAPEFGGGGGWGGGGGGGSCGNAPPKRGT